jgi:hypothetical protein
VNLSNGARVLLTALNSVLLALLKGQARQKRYQPPCADFGFAANQRQTEVKSEYRKKAGDLDAKYHQPGDTTTFKSILNEYGMGGEMLGLVVGYSGKASSDVYRVADLVATRLALKHLD